MKVFDYCAIVVTEYQLLQSESIVSGLRLENVCLIVANPGRLEPKIINRSLFQEIIFIPSIARYNSLQRLKLSYLNDYTTLTHSLLQGIRAKTIIGAQDENTDYQIIVDSLAPTERWSIEDGIANYYLPSLISRSKILFKNILFRKVYRKAIKVNYQHGEGDYARLYRMNPGLSINHGNKLPLQSSMIEYIENRRQFYHSLISEEERQMLFTKRMIIGTANKLHIHLTNDQCRLSVIKAHPESKENYPDSGIDILRQRVPIEILPLLFPNIKYVLFDNYFSSAILNLLELSKDVVVITTSAFTGDERKLLHLHKYLVQKYSTRYVHAIGKIPMMFN